MVTRLSDLEKTDPRAAVQVRGMMEAQRKLVQVVEDLDGTPILNAMRESVMAVFGQTQVLVPRDTQRLAASIEPEVLNPMGDTIEGVVGSNLEYAPHVEYGTRPHWPPLWALKGWAQRHGIPAYLVAKSIAEKGTSVWAFRKFGTKGFFFMKRTVERTEGYVRSLFASAIRKIVDK